MGDTSPFGIANIQQFAAAWYRALDIHAPVEACAAFLAEADLEMIFPEKTLQGLSDFKAWYAGGRYNDGETAPGVINIFFDENHNVVSIEAPEVTSAATDHIEVRVVVAWQASWFEKPAAKSKRTALDAIQTWVLRRCPRDKNAYGLEIVTYNAVAAPFVYAAGAARL
jgi:hypothetical protein